MTVLAKYFIYFNEKSMWLYFFLKGRHHHPIFPLKRRIFTKMKTKKKKMRIYNNASQVFSKQRKIKMKAVGKVRRWGISSAVRHGWGGERFTDLGRQRLAIVVVKAVGGRRSLRWWWKWLIENLWEEGEEEEEGGGKRRWREVAAPASPV
jgi:hypothetical protein